MSMQNFPRAGGLTYDADGNPINPAKEDGNLATLTGRVDVASSSGSARTKLVDAAGNPINPAKEDGHLAAIDTSTARLDVLLSTRAADATLTGGGQKTRILDGLGNLISSTQDGAKQRLDARLQAEAAEGAALPGTVVVIGGRSDSGLVRMPSVDGLPNGYYGLKTSSTQSSAHETFDDRMFSGQIEITATPGGTEGNYVFFRNPAASGKLAIFERFLFSSGSDVKGATFRVYLGTTVSAAGTAGTALNRRRKTSPVASAMEFFINPTVTARGSRLMTCPVSGNLYSSGFLANFKGDLILEPGQTMLITINPGANNQPVYAFGEWNEVAA